MTRYRPHSSGLQKAFNVAVCCALRRAGVGSGLRPHGCVAVLLKHTVYQLLPVHSSSPVCSCVPRLPDILMCCWSVEVGGKHGWQIG